MSTDPGPPDRDELADSLADYARWHMDGGLEDLAAGALGDVLQTSVQKRYDLGRIADAKPCIARLTHGTTQCHHDLDLARDQQDLVDADPPHRPVPAVHTDLWLRKGEPAAYSLHVDALGRDLLTSLLAFGHEHDLEVVVDPAAYRQPLDTVHVVLLPRDTEP